jgi:glycosyltransferase involved in cell wall biosynthesis
MKVERLIFLTTFDYPSRYAHAIHGLHMARAFHARFGDRFLFFINTLKKGETLSGIPYRLLFGRFGRRIKLLGLRRLLISIPLSRFFRSHAEWCGKDTVLFVNDPGLIPLAARLVKRYGFNLIFEVHGALSLEAEAILARVGKKVIFTTPFLQADALARTPNLPSPRVISNAVNVRAIDAVSEDRELLRKELTLPEGLLLGYVGRFEPLGYDKGLRFLLHALQSLPKEAKLVLVGGSKEEVVRYCTLISELGLTARVTVVPHVRGELVPRYLKACDILLYTPPSGSTFFEKETSPMKLYEYMAAKRPIIVSDLPTTRTILAPHDAYFIAPGSEEEFVHAVEMIQHNPMQAGEKIRSAFSKVASNTWEARVERILE